ncbi:hypothetical protein SVIOM342S_00894 [Streptomyces violaceorubidus]
MRCHWGGVTRCTKTRPAGRSAQSVDGRWSRYTSWRMEPPTPSPMAGADRGRGAPPYPAAEPGAAGADAGAGAPKAPPERAATRADSARRRSSSRQRASSVSLRVNACNWTPPQTSSPVTWPSTVAPMPSGTATN